MVRHVLRSVHVTCTHHLYGTEKDRQMYLDFQDRKTFIMTRMKKCMCDSVLIVAIV